MQKPDLSQIGMLDNGLSKWTVRLLEILARTFLWLAGLALLLWLPFGLFEYSEGLADLSRAEWAFMALLLLLLRRHDRYCRHFATGFWRGISRLLISQGLAVVVLLAALGACLIALGWSWTLDPDKSSLADQLEVLFYSAGLLDIVFYAAMLLATYLAAPHRHAPLSKNAAVDPTESDWQSPSVSALSQPEINP